MLGLITNPSSQMTLKTCSQFNGYVYFLPLHPLAIHHSQEKLHNMNNVNSPILHLEVAHHFCSNKFSLMKEFLMGFSYPKRGFQFDIFYVKGGQMKDDD